VLFIVATPIGNLGDLSVRAIETLRSVDTVLAEDTRVTRKLLNHIEANPKLERFDEHTAYAKIPAIVERVMGGEQVALVSDAGTPGISDPGQALIDAVLATGEGGVFSLPATVPITVIPGPSAVIAALTASGLPTDSFYFGGFLPRKKKALRETLEALASLDTTLVFYESPKRVVTSLEAAAEILGQRRGAIVRELTKIHEEVVRGMLPQLAEQLKARDSIKGEIVLLIAPAQKVRTARVHVDKYAHQN